MNTYVIHVSDNLKRENHINRELLEKEITPIFINDGDKKDLDSSIIKDYFKGEMSKISNATSCAYKHLLAYKKISKSKDNINLILEDDIFLFSNFSSILDSLKTEIKNREIENFMLSIEDSILKYIPQSKREKRKLIYEKNEGRLTGAYLIDKKGAENLFNYICEEKIGVPIDWFHNLAVSKKVIKMYWSQPTICCQGSINGEMKSLLRNSKWGFLRIFSFKIQRLYKKILYQLR